MLGHQAVAQFVEHHRTKEQEARDNSKHPVLRGTPRRVLGGELRAQR